MASSRASPLRQWSSPSPHLPNGNATNVGSSRAAFGGAVQLSPTATELTLMEVVALLGQTPSCHTVHIDSVEFAWRPSLSECIRSENVRSTQSQSTRNRYAQKIVQMLLKCGNAEQQLMTAVDWQSIVFAHFYSHATDFMLQCLWSHSFKCNLDSQNSKHFLHSLHCLVIEQC